jgi:hypothetical protein
VARLSLVPRLISAKTNETVNKYVDSRDFRPGFVDNIIRRVAQYFMYMYRQPHHKNPCELKRTLTNAKKDRSIIIATKFTAFRDEKRKERSVHKG